MLGRTPRARLDQRPGGSQAPTTTTSRGRHAASPPPRTSAARRDRTAACGPSMPEWPASAASAGLLVLPRSPTACSGVRLKTRQPHLTPAPISVCNYTWSRMYRCSVQCQSQSAAVSVTASYALG